MVDVTQAALELPDPLSKRGPYFGNSFRTEEQQHDQRKNEPVRDTEFAHRPLLSDQRAHCSLESQCVRASRIHRDPTWLKLFNLRTDVLLIAVGKVPEAELRLRTRFAVSIYHFPLL